MSRHEELWKEVELEFEYDLEPVWLGHLQLGIENIMNQKMLR
jgi:hypothetical protein